MCSVPPKFRTIKKWLREDGYTLLRRRGSSHEQYIHPVKAGRVTLSGSNNEEPAQGTWKSIRRQAHWDEEAKHDV
jgi:predicted RNA binding protein YcfA (HicA-like mRNA interferase family)